jgi:hypothetical protein
VGFNSLSEYFFYPDEILTEVAPIVWTLGLGGHWFMIASFEFGRAQVTKRRVSPLAIVKALDVFEDFGAGLSSGVPPTLVGQLEFESGEKVSATALSQHDPLRRAVRFGGGAV